MTVDALFSEPPRQLAALPTAPDPELVHGHVDVWVVRDGDDVEEVLAAGHGEDSRDALVHYLTAELGHPRDAADVAVDHWSRAAWVTFAYVCAELEVVDADATTPRAVPVSRVHVR